KRTITLDTSIRDDLKLVFEDSEELLQEYFKRWNIDPEGFDILNYLNPEYFGSKETDPRKPLTVGMLVESAKAGRWLYS
ncbi:cytoplasmic protein, partial [Salmonella enterica subsp. enterica serovar Schwarzengrund]|nr:cytoplasmic protein [Salmonella enterica subsp. enterica serovar Schwarzengrund]